MNNLKKSLNEAQKELRELEAKLNTKGSANKETRLIESSSNNSSQFYSYISGKGKKYIRKKDINIACNLAQRDYEIDVANRIKMISSEIDSLKESIKKFSLEGAYDDLSLAKKSLIKPIYEKPDLYVKRWQEEVYETKPILEGTKTFETEKGELVRSKSEKMIADKLYYLNIPYKYETKLYLKGFGYVYPDFKILSVKYRKEYYLEHFGMMDDIEYAMKATKKIKTYENSGYIMGKNIIYTFETSDSTFDPKILNNYIYEYIL